jgi:hypothetical protein
MTQSTIMRIVLIAACMGLLGGLLKNLNVLTSFFFAPQGSKNFYVITGFLFAEQLLFVPTICATRGLAGRSARMLRVGIVIGVITGMITAALILFFAYIRFRENHSWFDYIFVSAPILRVAAGIVNAFSDTLRRNVCSFAFMGLIGGGLAVLSYYLTVSVTTLTELFLSKIASPYAAYLFHKFGTPPILGAAISATVWWFTAIAEEYFYSRRR